MLAAILFFTSRGKPHSPPATSTTKSPQTLASEPGRSMKPGTSATPSADATPTKPKLEVCGVTDLPPAVGDAVEVSQYLFDTTRETYDRWKTALINDTDPRARAVGLALQRVDDTFAKSLAADTSLEQLIGLATTTQDPDIYSIAVGFCHTGLGDGEAPVPLCRRLSLSEWAKLDPDNAVPWLANAAAARQKGDSWAESAAFAQASQAHKVDGDNEALLTTAMAVFPADATLSARFAAELRLWGYDAARARPDFSELSRYCTPTALEQSQVHDQCEAMADLLVDHGGTLLDFSRGRLIGQRLGWPAARVDPLAQEKDALLQLLASKAGAEDWSCGHMAWTDNFLQRRLQIGELAALRELRDKKSSQ